MMEILQADKRPFSRVHLVSCYAPTRAASMEDKDAFFQELESIISSVPQRRCMFFLVTSMPVLGPGRMLMRSGTV